jgi:hypothetical protein
MAKYIVLEEFTTPLHRFRVDQQIDDLDIDGTLSVDDLVKLEKIELVLEKTDGKSARTVAPKEQARPADSDKAGAH